MTSDAASMPTKSPEAVPIRAVVLDLHQTLVDGGDTSRWLRLACQHLGRPVDDVLGGTSSDDLAAGLDDVWTHVGRLDPRAERDLDRAIHWRVFTETVAVTLSAGPDLADALYATMPEAMVAYADARPVLDALHRRGIRTALLSNVGFDVRPVLARDGLLELLDEVVLSFEVGLIKPDPAIFELVLDRLGVPAEQALMVGDSARADGGAAALGIRTLVLPRTRGPVHGLAAIVDLVGASTGAVAGPRVPGDGPDAASHGG